MGMFVLPLASKLACVYSLFWSNPARPITGAKLWGIAWLICLIRPALPEASLHGWLVWASGAGGLYQISRVLKDIFLRLSFLCLFLNIQYANTWDSLIRLQNTIIWLFLTASLLNLGFESLFLLLLSVSLMSRVVLLSSVVLFKLQQILISSVQNVKTRSNVEFCIVSAGSMSHTFLGLSGIEATFSIFAVS